MGVHNDTGTLGEHLVATHLRQVAPVQAGQAADLRMLDVEIEVKTARPSLYNGHTLGYQFLLRKPKHTDFRKSDVLVLLCLDSACEPVAVYVVPTANLRNRTKLTIPLSLDTRLATYRNRWDVIAEAYSSRAYIGESR